jgi:uncharacterized Fe-S cluster-containing radical SAM superfamily protein
VTDGKLLKRTGGMPTLTRSKRFKNDVMKNIEKNIFRYTKNITSDTKRRFLSEKKLMERLKEIFKHVFVEVHTIMGLSQEELDTTSPQNTKTMFN